MTSRRLRRFTLSVALGAVTIAASACGEKYGSDTPEMLPDAEPADASDASNLDGATPVDAGADVAVELDAALLDGSCMGVPAGWSQGVLCDRFEDQDAGAHWMISKLGAGSLTFFSDFAAPSPPGTLLSELPEYDAGQSQARLVATADKAKIIDCTFFINAATRSAADTILFFEVRQLDATLAHQLFLGAQNGSWFTFNRDFLAPVGGAKQTFFDAGVGWTKVRARLRPGAAAEVYLNDVLVHTGPAGASVVQTASIYIGLSDTNATAGGMAFYDDVRCVAVP